MGAKVKRGNKVKPEVLARKRAKRSNKKNKDDGWDESSQKNTIEFGAAAKADKVLKKKNVPLTKAVPAAARRAAKKERLKQKNPEKFEMLEKIKTIWEELRLSTDVSKDKRQALAAELMAVIKGSFISHLKY